MSDTHFSIGDVVTTRDGVRICLTTVSACGGFLWGYFADDANRHWQHRRWRHEFPSYSVVAV